MNCKICDSTTKELFIAKLLYKHDVSYYQCTNCGFAQTEKPYWLDEAYKSSMNISDTGVMYRSERMSKIVTTIICLFYNKKGTFLDYAGGLGVFTRAMRDVGFNYYWNDPFTKNELARGFEGNLDQKYEAITTFESFEHFENPLIEIEKILKSTDTIILSTDVINVPAPKHADWWYYGSEHGQHISFYSLKSFEEIAKKFKLNYYNAMNVHVLTKKDLGFFAKIIFKYFSAKHLLYLGFYFCNPFMKTRAIDDMNSFYSKKN